MSAEFQHKQSTVPWSDMTGMRNILIHDYLGVDVNEVWKTIRDDLPVLKQQVEAVLNPPSE